TYTVQVDVRNNLTGGLGHETSTFSVTGGRPSSAPIGSTRATAAPTGRRGAIEGPYAATADFHAVTPAQRLEDYHRNESAVEADSRPTAAEDLQVLDGKWIFRSALGRGPILVTHPLSPDRPSTYRVHTDGKPVVLSVHAHPWGDSRIELWAERARLFAETISA